MSLWDKSYVIGKKISKFFVDELKFFICLLTIEAKASQGQVITTMNVEDEHIHQNEQEKYQDDCY